MKTKEEQLIEQIENLSESELVQLNNTYCQCCGIDSEAWGNDEEFFNLFFPDAKAFEALQRAHFGDYNWSHDYVKFDGYGNLESFQCFELKDLCELPSVIAAYALENESDFSYILSFEFEEEEEEE